MMKKVVVVGLGYVGLPLALAIERSEKYDLVGYDIDSKKVKMINDKVCPITDDIAENDLKELDFRATSEEKYLKGSDIFLICVPTPIFNDYTPDYGPIISASRIVAKYLKKGGTVILESTVNPGTCEEVMLPELESNSGLKAGKDFNIAMCPERINPGDLKWNIYNIPRNVGSLIPERVSEVANFYRSFLDTEVHEVSSIRIAEATKIVENTFRDINIAFVNELARSFDAIGIDLVETLKGSSNKPFAFMAHWPGRGVGGHCIAVDPYYLIKKADIVGFNHRFLKVARDINNSMPKYTVMRLQSVLNEIKLPINGTKVAVLGLSYKENVADLRESPCLIIIKELEDLGADVLIFDPYTPERNTYKSLEETLGKSDAVLLCTAHKEFSSLSDDLSKYDNIKAVVDGMNKLDKDKILDLGKAYRGIGR